MDGRQAAEAARERLPALPVLFVTGYAGAAPRPGVEVVGQPFATDILARRVQASPATHQRDPGGDPGA